MFSSCNDQSDSCCTQTSVTPDKRKPVIHFAASIDTCGEHGKKGAEKGPRDKEQQIKTGSQHDVFHPVILVKLLFFAAIVNQIELAKG